MPWDYHVNYNYFQPPIFLRRGRKKGQIISDVEYELLVIEIRNERKKVGWKSLLLFFKQLITKILSFQINILHIPSKSKKTRIFHFHLITKDNSIKSKHEHLILYRNEVGRMFIEADKTDVESYHSYSSFFF